MVETTFACWEQECTEPASWHIIRKGPETDLVICERFSCFEPEHLADTLALDYVNVVEGVHVYLDRLNKVHIKEVRPWYTKLVGFFRKKIKE